MSRGAKMQACMWWSLCFSSDTAKLPIFSLVIALIVISQVTKSIESFQAFNTYVWCLLYQRDSAWMKLSPKCYRWSFAPASIGHNRIHPKMFPKNNVQSEIIQNWKFFLNCMFWLAYIDFKRFQISDRWWWWWLQCRRMRHFELWNNLADIMQPTFLIQMRSKGL